MAGENMHDPLILGIDEAGRGPVLGPMVVAGVLLRESNLAALIDLKPRDSKQLSRVRRAQLMRRMKPLFTRVETVVINPNTLSAHNLNTLTFKAIIRLFLKTYPDKMYIDAPVGPSRLTHFRRQLQKTLKSSKKIEIIAENRADVNRPIVSAASIVAKVHRDKYMQRINRRYCLLGEAGSGYSSDPVTRAFLARYYQNFHRWPREARAKWATLNVIANSQMSSSSPKTYPLPWLKGPLRTPFALIRVIVLQQLAKHAK